MYETALQNATRYAERQGIQLIDQLGSGLDGIVLTTNRQSAVKALRYRTQYEREKSVYLRLEKNGVGTIGGFNIPRLIGCHDDFMVVEMEVVSPPFIVDFAGAYLDEEPDFPPEILRDWIAEKREQFGSRWPAVRSAIAEFRQHGIHIVDAKPGNVMFS
ncbi:MAG: hypothetical protein DWQ34_08800 [Planctomycetota bacterium]|nr:MAG: hypothetical protein DWQ34_08800 [Planctomycetota bacterium]REK23176.1 MAG: hypothetical protein DWQ41_17255 [Planctomycetota bacterium]REK30906.1 MAG: hypothetical protein DWQ45_20935 [Planctomycetota bacterium]